MERKDKKVSVDELIAIVNSQEKDFILHIEFEHPANRYDAMKEYFSVK